MVFAVLNWHFLRDQNVSWHRNLYLETKQRVLKTLLLLLLLLLLLAYNSFARLKIYP